MSLECVYIPIMGQNKIPFKVDIKNKGIYTANS